MCARSDFPGSFFFRRLHTSGVTVNQEDVQSFHGVPSGLDVVELGMVLCAYTEAQRGHVNLFQRACANLHSEHVFGRAASEDPTA